MNFITVDVLNLLVLRNRTVLENTATAAPPRLPACLFISNNFAIQLSQAKYTYTVAHDTS